jgi:hypothetical protein
MSETQMETGLRYPVDLGRFLRGRWENLFGVKFDILHNGLATTYFENDPP